MFKRLFFDIETSPAKGWFWGPGRNITLTYDNIEELPKIICVAYKWWQDADVTVLSWDKKQNDRTLLQKFLPVLELADEAIAQNGDRFDVPWLRARSAYHGLPMPATVVTLDTLTKARKGFKFPSNRLDALARYFGIPGKKKVDFELWKQVCNRVPGALEQMVEYCGQDVFVLQAVYERLRPYITPAVHVGAVEDGDGAGCPTCAGPDYHYKKLRHTAAGKPRHQLMCLACSSYYSVTEKQLQKMAKERIAA